MNIKYAVYKLKDLTTTNVDLLDTVGVYKGQFDNEEQAISHIQWLITDDWNGWSEYTIIKKYQRDEV